MYCCGDPKVKTVTGEAFCELGKDMKGYAYTDMWAGPPKYDGTYDVDDSVVGMIRTVSPLFSLCEILSRPPWRIASTSFS